MTIRTVDEDIRLIPYYRNDAASLPWYQDLDVCKQVDDRDTPYDAALLHRMYDYLCANGDCWYIEYRYSFILCRKLRTLSEFRASSPMPRTKYISGDWAAAFRTMA